MPIIGGGAASGAGITELSYVELTAQVNIASSTEATPTLVVAAAALTFDGGTKACIEFFAPGATASSTGVLFLSLWDGATNLGQWGVVVPAGSGTVPVLLRRFLTPSNGSHTYKVQGYMSAGAGANVVAGTGGAGAKTAGYIRVTSGS